MTWGSSRRYLRAAGLLVCGLGLGVLVDWHVGSGSVVYLLPGHSGMAYRTAVCLALLGLALATVGGRSPSWVFAATAGAIAMATLGQYLWRVALGLPIPAPGANSIHQIPYMAPNTALATLLAAASLLALQDRWLRASLAGLCATMVMALASVAWIGYLTGLTGTYAWGSYIGMAPHTATALFILGAALARGAIAVDETAGAPVGWAPAAAGIAVVVASVCVWNALVVQERENFHRSMAASGAIVGDVARAEVETVAREMRAAQAASTEAGLADWAAPGVELIGEVDGARALRWKFALQPGRAGWPDLAAPAAREALDVAARERMAVSRGLSGGQAGRFLVVSREGNGFKIAVCRCRDFFFRALAEREPLHLQGIAVRDASGTLYASPHFDLQAPEPMPRVDLTGPLRGWQVVIIPSVADRRASFTRLPAVVLVLGLVLACLLGVTLQLRGTAARRSHDLAVANARLRSITESVYDAIVVADETDCVQEVNEAACRLFGYPREVLRGKPLTMLMPERMRGEHHRGLNRFVETGQSSLLGHPIEVRGQRSDGVEITLEICLAAWRMGERWYFTGILRDIGARKRVEEEMLRAAVASESANRMKSQFLANMSHEIRTPMNAVIGLAGLAAESEDMVEVRAYLEKILLASQGLLRLLNDILDLARIEAGRLAIECAPFAVKGLLDETVSIHAEQARAQGCVLTACVAPEVPPYVSGDGGRIRQILTNLISNAVKFTENGAIDVTVLLDQQEGARLTLRFAVRDTGRGLSAESHSYVFQPFQQADGSDARRHGGAGLGLAISAQLCEAMGGRIGVESEPGQGSTFHFTVPVEASASPAVPAEAVAATGVPTCRRLRVLVAEDNEFNRIVTVGWLQKLGHAAESAPDGAQTVAAARSGDFDVILMDVQMPGMDGLEAARRIRSTEAESGRHVPIFALSASVMAADRDRCVAAGMDGFLSKPLQLEALRSALGEVAVPDSVAVKRSEAPAQGVVDGVMERVQDREAVFRIVGIFLEQAPRMLNAMREAVRDDDVEKLRRTLHTLGGNAAVLGAAPLRAAVAVAEQTVQEANRDRLSAAIEGVEAESATLLQEVRRELDRFRGCSVPGRDEHR